MIIYIYAQYFQFSCMMLAFLFSLKTIKNRNVVGYMRNFFWYSLVAVVSTSVGVILNFKGNLSSSNYFIANKLSFIFHFIFLSIFIYNVLENLKTKKMFLFLFLFFLTIILIEIFNTLTIPRSYMSGSITNFFLVIFSLIYYFDLFDGIPKKSLLNESAFWVVSGLFLCLTITVPLNAVRNFFGQDKNSDIYFSVGAILSVAYGIMHIFFIKAYLCSVSLKKNS